MKTTDAQLMNTSGYVHVDSTAIGCSDHYLVWIELGWTPTTTRKAKCVMRKRCFQRFEDKEIKLSALPEEVSGFVQSIQDKAERRA